MKWEVREDEEEEVQEEEMQEDVEGAGSCCQRGLVPWPQNP